MYAIVEWMLSRKIFVARTSIFAIALLLTLISRDFAIAVFNFNFAGGVKVYHILWTFIMTEMILVLIPKLDHFIGCGKIYEKNYTPRAHALTALSEYTKKFDRRAIYAALVWATALAGIWFFRLEKYWVIISAIFFYFLDQLFVNLWCPFKNWIVRNRCCATCRIYNWGFAIIVSPLIFIKSFWTYSLVAMGAVILLQWEILHRKYPERFSEISNAMLSCKNCNDRCSSFTKEHFKH
ncbi:MAG: hypothetical protein ACQES4_01880 [Bacillota bacterium]